MDAEDDKTISRKDMSNWQDLTLEERMVILQQVAKTEKIPQSAIEKDWWVTAVLKAIFQTEAAPKMLFKGGTSFSKGWHLIERLSEDVDLAIDHTFFGINGTTKSQRDKLRKTSRKYIQETLSKSLENNLTTMGCHGFSIENVTEKPSGEPLDSDVDPTVMDRCVLALAPVLNVFGNFGRRSSRVSIHAAQPSVESALGNGLVAQQ